MRKPRGPYKPKYMKKQPYATKFPEWFIEWLQENKNNGLKQPASRILLESVCKCHNLTPPS